MGSIKESLYWTIGRAPLFQNADFGEKKYMKNSALVRVAQKIFKKAGVFIVVDNTVVTFPKNWTYSVAKIEL